jgi:hypothetical protein
MKRRKFVQVTSVGVLAASLPLEAIAAPLPPRSDSLFDHRCTSRIIMIDDGRVSPAEASVFRGSPILVPSNELAIDDVQWFVLRPTPPPWGVGVHHALVPFDGNEPEATVVIGSHDNLIWESREVYDAGVLRPMTGGMIVSGPGRVATSVVALESTSRDWDRVLQQASKDFPGSILDQVILVSRFALARDTLSWGSYILVDGEVEKFGGKDTPYKRFAAYTAEDYYDWVRAVITLEARTAKGRWPS